MIWEEPAKGGYPDRSFLGLPGIERMGAGRRGLIPYSPMSYLTELERPRHRAALDVLDARITLVRQPFGPDPAGVLALIGDAALGSVVHSDVEAGQGMTTAELSMSFLRPVVPRRGAVVTGSGQLIHRGRSIGISEAFLFDDEDQLISHGTTRCSVFPPLDPIPDPPDPHALPCSSLGPEARRTIPCGVRWRERPFAGGVRASKRARAAPAVIGGELPRPPIHHLTGLSAGRGGRGVAVLPCSKWLSTSAGTIQGGFTAMLAEGAMTSAAFTTAPPDTAVAALDFKVNYLRPVFPDANELTARARILHQGRTLAIAAAEITNAEGKQVALATGSSMYLPGRPANLLGVELGSGSSDPDDDPGA